MLSPAEGRRHRRALLQDIAREERKRQRRELAELLVSLRDARRARAEARREAKIACKQGRRQLREDAKALRARLLAELRTAIAMEKAAARETCSVKHKEASDLGDRAERARLKFEAERAYRAEMRRIERANRDRHRELAKAHGGGRRRRSERAGESDDEVLVNLPPELHPLWRRVGPKIRASERSSRTETFLKYAEEHPDEVLGSLDDLTELRVRELEQGERRLRKALRSPRRGQAPQSPSTPLDDAVPF